MPMYKYYAVIEREQTEDTEGYTVSFPDLAGCITEGDSLSDAVSCAEEALGGYLLASESFNDDIPMPSKPESIKVPEGASLILVEVNTDKE